EKIIIHATKNMRGGKIDSHGDHRIAMMAAVIAANCQDKSTIYGCEAVKKSYPDFFDCFRELGGKTDVVDLWE
ncbi:MAG: 3-phosphoshikimate 1-carboxyvinyltransferase, partial [Clostridia bacterium]